MRPDQPALRIALSIVSSLSQPCSSATCGRYVAEKVWRGGRDAAAAVVGGVGAGVASGDGADEGEGATGSRDGCGKVMWIPCTPTVQSRYESASSNSVRRDTLRAAHHRGSKGLQRVAERRPDRGVGTGVPRREGDRGEGGSGGTNR